MRYVGPRHFHIDPRDPPPAAWEWGRGFAGQVVTIIGNGPSLGSVSPEALRGHRHVAINSACRWAAPIVTADDFLYFADNSWNENHPALAAAWRGVIVTCNRYAAARLAPRARLLDVTALSLAVRGNPDHLHASSAHTAAVLAAAMGAARVVLLGMDGRIVAGRSHWHDDYQSMDPSPYADRFIPGWFGVARVVESLGAEIVNATPDSAVLGIPFLPLPKAVAAFA